MDIPVRKLLNLLRDESNLEGIVTCFVQLVMTYFDCQYIYLYKIKQENKSHQFQVFDSRLDPDLELSCLSFNLIKASFRLMLKNKTYWYSDCFQLDTNERIINFLFFGYPSKSWLVCLWDDRLQNKESLEFLIRHIQHECLWLSRIEKKNEMIYRDNLTGLYNYRYFSLFFEQEVKRFTRYRRPFSLLFLDIDYFKLINDQYGHLVGSDVLCQFARVLKSLVREVDLVVRYGGDEFIVILLNANKKIAQKVSNRICLSVEKKAFIYQQLKIYLTVSIGISSYSDYGISKQQLIKTADKAMYESKKKGRNQVSYLELN